MSSELCMRDRKGERGATAHTSVNNNQHSS
jgi:hypothetical protein